MVAVDATASRFGAASMSQRGSSFACKLLVLSILLYFWGSEFYTFFPFSPNLVMGVFVVLSLLTVYAFNLTHVRGLVICYVGLLMLYTTVVASSVSENFSDAIRIVTVLLLFFLFAEPGSAAMFRRAIASMKTFVGLTAVLLSLLGLLELFLPMCYMGGAEFEKGGWGTGSYFAGFTTSPHMAASNSILLLMLLLLYLQDRKFSVSEMILLASPALMVLQSGARTYLIPLACGVVVYYRFRLRRQRTRVLIMPLVIIAVSYAALNTGMLEKFVAVGGGSANASSSDDFLFSFTNSRTLMYDGLLGAFGDLPAWGKVFGAGFTYAEESLGGTGAHNDLLYMLICAGVVGAAVWVAAVVGMVKSSFALGQGKGMGPAFSLIMAAYILFPALLNGIYNNPHFVFSCVFFLAYLSGCSDDSKRDSLKSAHYI